VTKATAAALAVGGKLAIPDVGSDRPHGQLTSQNEKEKNPSPLPGAAGACKS
jgi:phage/plasmid primase-like uncharacterized protein